MLEVIGYRKIPRRKNNHWIMVELPIYKDLGPGSHWTTYLARSGVNVREAYT